MPDLAPQQRSYKRTLRIAFLLLAILPVLAIVKIGLVLVQQDGGTMNQIEACALAAFVIVSIGCGFIMLRMIGKSLEHVSSATNAVLDRLAAQSSIKEGVKVPHSQFSGECDIATITHALSKIQAEIAVEMEHISAQANFLENLQRVLNHSRDIVVILDEENRITFSNQAAREKLGLLPDHSLRHSLAEGLLIEADATRLGSILEKWEGTDTEISCTRSNGQPITIHCVQTVIQAKQGKQRGKIIIMRDLTEYKHLERQLYRSEQLAVLGQLISGVAHELNNPLTAVVGFAELCRDPNIPREDLNSYLALIEREANRTSHIVENLLSFSRQRKNKRTQVDIHAVIERCLSLFTYNFRTNRIELHRQLAPAILQIEADEYQLQQIFMNLIINAVQAMLEAKTPHPQLNIRTVIAPGGNDIVVEISDNGPGIPPHILPHIYDPFFSTKSDDRGTGLGLAVSRNIITNHSGEIAVRTTVNKGTTFAIRFPACTKKSSVILDERTPPVLAAMPAQSGSKGHILLMDDEPALLEMMRRGLHAKGWTTMQASGFEEGRACISMQKFDAVVSDIHMPDGKGQQLQAHAKEVSPVLSTHFLYITGDPEAAQRLMLAPDAPAVLLKPFHIADLDKALLDLLASKVPADSV